MSRVHEVSFCNLEAVVGIPCLQSHFGSFIKALQPPLDVLSWNTKHPFSETNSVVSSLQNNVNVLLFLHSVPVSNGLDTHGLLTITKYIMVLISLLLQAWLLLLSRHLLHGSLHKSHCLTVFSFSVDVKEAAAHSFIITWLK